MYLCGLPNDVDDTFYEYLLFFDYSMSFEPVKNRQSTVLHRRFSQKIDDMSEQVHIHNYSEAKNDYFDASADGESKQEINEKKKSYERKWSSWLVQQLMKHRKN
jgi:hypothetical protein